jgi:hypothetical protein
LWGGVFTATFGCAAVSAFAVDGITIQAGSALERITVASFAATQSAAAGSPGNNANNNPKAKNRFT